MECSQLQEVSPYITDRKYVILSFCISNHQMAYRLWATIWYSLWQLERVSSCLNLWPTGCKLHCISCISFAAEPSQYTTESEWSPIEMCNGCLSIACLAGSEWKCLCFNYSSSMTNRKWVPILHLYFWNVVLIVHTKQQRVSNFIIYCIISNEGHLNNRRFVFTVLFC
jgi:hypothetical protein